MRTICNFCMMMCLLVTFSCEKPEIEGEHDTTSKTETPNGGSEGDGYQGDTDEDNDATYEETDIVDGDQETDYRNKTYGVREFIKASLGQRPVKVEGYIVGACTKSIKYAEWNPPFTHEQAILLADQPYTQNSAEVISIQLRKGTMRSEFNLVEHPENYGKRAYFYGSKHTYLGITGMKDDITGYGWAE